MEMAVLTKKKKDYLKDYYKLKAKQAKIAKELELIRTFIDDEVEYGQYEFDGLKVSVEEKTRLIEDKVAIKKALGPKYEKMKKESSYLSVSIKKVS
jgi:predicted DNA-binding protein YlxM (UPF0122 family)